MLVEDECLEGNEIVTRDVVELHDGLPNEDEEHVPVIGMKFENYDKVFEFYKKYDARVGFPVRKRTSRKDKEAMADKVANDDVRAGKLMEWIESVSHDLDSMNMDQRSEGKSDLHQSILVDSVNGGVDKILGLKISDPNHVKRKGAPRKLRQKGALEKISKKLK
ncbi:protein FAR1-RELATED SEQUENCE 5, partial [Striga asiatica]